MTAGNYEVRMLRVPALYVVALWLKDLDGDDDLIVPLVPAPAFLEAGRAYREAEFLDTLEAPRASGSTSTTRLRAEKPIPSSSRTRPTTPGAGEARPGATSPGRSTGSARGRFRS